MRSILLLITLSLAACVDNSNLCGDLVEDRATGSCQCPEGTTRGEDVWTCVLPDGGVIRDPNADGGTDATVDSSTGVVGCRSYRDEDGDGYGDPNAVGECPPPDGYVANDEDCDDSRAEVSPADVESCNGLDDDCDGGGDETFECPQGSTATPCTTSCGSMGVARCSDFCTINSCVPPVESCSYADDDCDGEIDEALQSLVPSRDYGMGTAALRTWTFGGETPVVFGLYAGGLWLAQRFTAGGEPTGAEVEVHSTALFGSDANVLVVDITRVGDGGYALLVPNAAGTALEVRRLGPDLRPLGAIDIIAFSAVTLTHAVLTASSTHVLVAYLTADEATTTTELWLQSMTSELVAQPARRFASPVNPLLGVSVAAQADSFDAWVSYVSIVDGLRLEKVRINNGNRSGGLNVVDAGGYLPTMAIADDGTIGLLYGQTTGEDSRLNFQVRDGVDGSLRSTRTLPDRWSYCAGVGIPIPLCRPSDVVWSGSRWLVSRVRLQAGEEEQETSLHVYDSNGSPSGEILTLARSTNQFRMSSGTRLPSGGTLLTIPTPVRPRYALFGCP
jgi:hypothetical protein